MFRDRFALSRDSRNFGIIAAFLLLLGLTAGSGRDDMISLTFIRPIAILLFFYGLFGITRESWTNNRSSIIFMAAVFLFVLAYLIPLPASIWQSLSGHELIAGIDRAVGLGDVARPLSIAPRRTLNAFFSLFVPAATLLLMLRLDHGQRWRTLYPVLAFGTVSVFLTLLQAAAPSAGGLWLYRLTNDGIPVGLFANRNHAAVFHATLLPMLAVMVQMPARGHIWPRIRSGLAILVGVAALAAAAASGSRAGLLCAIAAVASLPLLIALPAKKPPKRRVPTGIDWRAKLPDFRSRRMIGVATLLVVVAIGTLALTSERSGGGAQRLAETSQNEQRVQIWQQSQAIAQDYMPYGSGPGTFVEAYKMQETVDMLGPNYINHAHNDFVEIAMTSGVGGLTLLGVVIFAWARDGWRLWSQKQNLPEWERNFGRMAWVCLAILGLSSFIDYPLRVPSLAAVATLLFGWMWAAANGAGRSSIR